MTFLAKLRSSEIPEKYQAFIEQFYTCYKAALSSHGLSIDDYIPLFETFLTLVTEQVKNPYDFEPYHHRIRSPFDYYKFGIDFLKPLVDLPRSTVVGKENFATVMELLEKKENVIFLSNHQTEADPQAISILLEETLPQFAEEMIFIAGERVVTDPLAIPFSLGRNLLCIFSKRYVDNPPEDKMKKLLHNKKTMEIMSSLLSEGGKAIYVAASGGRDRPNAQGEIVVTPFESSSIEMLYLMAQRAQKPTHFFTLSLATYGMLPPPDQVQSELGEARTTSRGALHIACGKEINMEFFPGSDHTDKHERRKARADFIWQQVQNDYSKL